MLRVAILDDYQSVALEMADWSVLEGRAEIVRFDRHVADPAKLADQLKGFDAIVAMRERTRFDADMLGRLPDLRLLVTTGMVNRSIDLKAAQARGVVVCGTPGSGKSAAELSWALILALARHIPAEAASVRSGDPQWQRGLGIDLAGLTLGVVGFGKLGRHVARIGLAFDMDVIAWSRSLTDQIAAEHGVRRADTLDVLLAESDVVSLHLTLTPQTRGMIGARELGLMKPGALLVNTARGPIVDEAALVEALRSGRIGGAGLDVFDVEPLPADHPLRTLDRVVATPHVGYVTERTYRAFYGGAVEALAAWLDGTPVRVLNT